CKGLRRGFTVEFMGIGGGWRFSGGDSHLRGSRWPMQDGPVGGANLNMRVPCARDHADRSIGSHRCQT
ncbi:MAG TPA: hypothetical protein VLJ57_07430, partial [Burkholderiaceae bacterium]|nr:hypothetical protein [Burkholderiaceae bacterium]